jgi:phospholipid/cholesterol/gamma-HCH transport system permease protein
VYFFTQGMTMHQWLYALNQLGCKYLQAINWLGDISLFFGSLLRACAMSLHRPYLVVQQLYGIGVQSLVIISASGFFVGMVLGVQMYDTLLRFGSGDSVGMVVALALVRELSPVLSALLFASRAGSAITAEVGLMKSSEQIMALDAMGVDPLARILAPRFLAGCIALPLLNSIFCALGVLGGYVMCVWVLGVDAGIFWSQMRAAIDLQLDVATGFIKSLVFAVAISLIAVFNGYQALATPEGVSRATTDTVVESALALFFLDFFLTLFMYTRF